MTTRRHNITGQRFSRLLAESVISVDVHGHTRWRCRCDCGTVVTVLLTNLRAAKVQSCGCLGVDRHTTHGLTNSRAYVSWSKMKGRCSGSGGARSVDWQGRGITVCARWLSFENFYADMGDPPTTKHSLDRINNDGNYEPSNCRWATAKEQANNRRPRRKKCLDRVRQHP